MRDRITAELEGVTRKLTLITTADPKLEKVVQLRAGNFHGTNEEREELVAVSERPGTQPKLEKLQELKGQISRLHGDLDSLAT